MNNWPEMRLLPKYAGLLNEPDAMNDWPDMRLLREYAEHGEEKAFTLLVSRHLAMVYQSALRQTRQPELAREIAQTVFTILARKASHISENTLLSGWLFNTTRFVSTRAVRDEMRRQRREAQAVCMNSDSFSTEPPVAAERLLPYLDEMLARLTDRDRQALLVRYFEGKSFQQVGMTVGLTEEAAKKRVRRALDKLRRMLRARGIVITVAATGAAFEAAKAESLPAGLSAAAVSSAAVKGACGATAVSALTQTTLEILKWTKIKATAAACVAVALAIGSATHFLTNHTQTTGIVVPASQDPEAARLGALQQTVERLRHENAELVANLAAANGRKAQLISATEEAQLTAQQSREIAARNLAPTNGVATMRDAFVSVGRLMRMSSLEATNVPASEQKQAREAANQETVRLLQAAGQFDLAHLDEYSPASPEEAADLTSGMLHGIVELTPEQFSQVRDALSKYEAQVLRDHPQQKLALPDDLEQMGPALAGVRALLSDQQNHVLDQVLRKVAPGTVSTAKPGQPAAHTKQ